MGGPISTTRKALILLSTAGLVGLAIFLWRVDAPKIPTVSIRNLDVELLPNETIRLLITAELENNWNLPLRALTSTYSVHRNSVLIATGQAKLRSLSDGKAKVFRIELPLVLQAKKLRNGPKESSANLPELTISGKLLLRGDKRSLFIPYRFTRRIPTRKPAAGLEIQALKAAFKNPNQLDVVLDLAIDNPLPKPIGAAKIDYVIRAAARDLAKGSLKAKGAIAAKSRGSFRLPFSLDLEQVKGLKRLDCASAFSLEVIAKVDATVDGRALRFPLHVTKSINPCAGQINTQINSVRLQIQPTSVLANISLRLSGSKLAHLEGLRADVQGSLAGQSFLQAHLALKKKDASSETAEIEIPLRLDPRALRGSQSPAPARSTEGTQAQTAPLTLKGTISAMTEGRRLSFPFQLTKDVPLNRNAIAISALSLGIVHDGDKIRLHPRIQLDGLPPQLRAVQATYRVLLAGQRVATGKAKLNVTSESRRQWLRLDVNLKANALRMVQQNRAGKLTSVQIAGGISIVTKDKMLEIPFDLRSSVILSRKPLKVELRSFGIDQKETGQVRIAVKADVHSTLRRPIRNVAASYSVFANAVPLASGRLSIPKLPADRPTPIELPVVIDPTQWARLQKSRSGEEITLDIKGELSARIAAKPIRVSFRFKHRISGIGKQIETTIQGIAIKELDPKQFRIDLDVGLKSRLKKHIGPINLTYRGSMDDIEIIRGKLNIPTLPPESSTQTRLPITVELGKLKGLAQKKAGQFSKLDLKGRLEAKIGDRQIAIPFALSKRFRIPSLGISAKLKHLHVNALSDRRIQLTASLDLGNIPARAGQTPTASYRVAIDGQQLLNGTAILEPNRSQGSALAKLVVTLDPHILKGLRKEGRKAHLLSIRGVISLVKDDKNLDLPFHLEKSLFLKDTPFSFKLEEIRLKEMSPKRVVLEALVHFRSQLPTKITGLAISYQAKAKGVVVFSGKNAWKAIDGDNGQRLVFPLVINTGALKGAKAPEGKKTSLGIAGQVVASIGSRTVEMSFETQKQVALVSKPFAVSIRKITLDSMEFGKRFFIVDVAIKNNTTLNLSNVTVEGKIILAKGVEAKVVDKKFQLKAGGSTRINVRLRVERFGLLRLLSKRPKKGGWQLVIKGETTAGGKVESHDERKASAESK